MACPRCSTENEGSAKFCAECGTPFDGARCEGCAAELLDGARFCTSCGRPVRARASRLPWYIAGTTSAALIVALLWPQVVPSGRGISAFSAPGASGSAGPPGAATGLPDGANPPPLTGTPREQADRLFNRVMAANAAGDGEEAAFFTPMAIAAYEQAGELDADGLFHLSLLHAANGDASASRTAAEAVLERDPNHLLALAAAAAAAEAEGDAGAARRYHERLLENYDAERARALPEYQDHAQVLPEYRAAAEAYTGG